MSITPGSAAANDIAYLFHPATNARRHEQIGPMIIERGNGIYVYDDQGKEYIEGLAGLWGAAVGFSEERLADAAAKQMRKLPYYHGYNHKSNPGSIALAQRLIQWAPEGMSKVFFTSSGSEANETAIKLVWYYNNARGRTAKKKIISRKGGYHGTTIAAGSLTGLPLFQRDFDLPIANFLHVSCPHYYRFGKPGETEEEFSTRLATELDDLIVREGADTVAAFFGEPLLGAGGVMTPPATYWDKIQAVLRKHDVLLVADEVITGFGRTGKMFACETYGIKPDMMIVSKAISSSYVPLAAVMFSDEIYQKIADNSQKLGALGHGFTTGGHPLAMAVALENLNIIEERDLVGNVQKLAPQFQAELRKFAEQPLVGEARGIGLIGAIELVEDKATKKPFEKPGTGARVAEACQKHGLIVRAIGDSIAFCPPMIITSEQISEMFRRFGKALAEVTASVEESRQATAKS